MMNVTFRPIGSDGRDLRFGASTPRARCLASIFCTFYPRQTDIEWYFKTETTSSGERTDARSTQPAPIHDAQAPPKTNSGTRQLATELDATSSPAARRRLGGSPRKRRYFRLNLLCRDCALRGRSSGEPSPRQRTLVNRHCALPIM